MHGRWPRARPTSLRHRPAKDRRRLHRVTFVRKRWRPHRQHQHTATKFAKARARVAAKRAQALATRQSVACKFTCYDELLPLYGETRSRTQLRRAIKAGEYPAPKQLSPQRIGWVTAELDAYYDNLPTVDYAPTAKKHAA